MKNLTRRGLLVSAGGFGLCLAAGPLLGQHVYKEIHALKPGEFTWHPERQPRGPVAVIASLDEQLVHVYRNGVRIAVSTCSTGKPGHETPTGVFVVLQKDRDHKSSTYNNAPMPNMNRLTWGGIALHAGNLPGYPANRRVATPHQAANLPSRTTRITQAVQFNSLVWIELAVVSSHCTTVIRWCTWFVNLAASYLTRSAPTSDRTHSAGRIFVFRRKKLFGS